MSQQGQYIYAIAWGVTEKDLGLTGIGDGGNAVYAVCHRDISAVVSDSPIIRYPISRANTITHQKIMEEVMKEHVLLPVRFGTIGEGVDQIRKKVLAARYDELVSLLQYMSDKIELGLKALWNDRDAVFREIVEANTNIRRLRDRLCSSKVIGQQDQVRLGRIVKEALDHKREQEEKALLAVLKKHWVECRRNKIFGDQMVTNSAFLVEKGRESHFDQAVSALAERYKSRMTLKYVGPVPPSNFVEITISW